MRISYCPHCETRLRGEIARCPFDGTMLLPVEDPLVGRTIAGRYLIEEKLGDGGMGTVYRGRHQVIDRAVAVKFLKPRFAGDTRQRKRFLGEARAANQINHEHVIDVTDFGETEDGLVYLVMEYLAGYPLSTLVRSDTVDLPRVLRIAAQIAMGLARAHELDVIHRDVKPSNIFLLRGRKERDFVKLLDFGIAHFEREMRITDRGALVGTPEYMAPEQLRQGDVSPRSDLYSLGCVVYEMLTGSPPFTGPVAAVLVKQMTQAATPPAAIAAGVPPELDGIVLKLLQKNPKDRYRDAFHLLEDLGALLEAHPETDPLTGRGAPSHPAPASQPTIHVPNETREWEQRVEMYRALLRRAFPNGPPPPDLTETLGRMEATLREVTAHREELRRIALGAAEEQEDVRQMQASIGYALDVLSKDESQATRQEEALQSHADELDRAIDHVGQQIAGTAHALYPLPADPMPLSKAVRRELEQLVAYGKRLSEDRTRLSAVRFQIDARRRELEDLRFQIAQLKGRLATLSAALDIDRGDTDAREQLLDREVREKLEALVPEAEKISGRLRKHPAYGTVFKT